MAISAGVGSSKNQDSYQAAYEACRAAVEGAGGKPNLLFVFSSVALDQEQVLRGIKDIGGDVPMIGCTDAGAITVEGPMQKGVAVMAIRADLITFTTGLGSGIHEDPRAAGRAVAREVQERAPEPPHVLIMFPDVLAGNGADIVRGVLDVFGPNFIVVGGAAADDFQFQKTYQYHGNQLVSGAVAAVGLSGKFTMGVGVRHGWIPIGPPMKVTKSAGAVVYELDNRPAVSIYEDYFGSDAQDLRREPLARMAITYPLGIKVPDMDEYLIRDPVTVDEQGAITCAAEIPEGSEIRLMIGSKEKAIEAARDAARKVMSDLSAANSTPKFMLMFNCIAREKLFGVQAKDEINAIMEIVGKEVPLLGFYTYGEQAPMGGEIRNISKIHSQFYNETVVMLAVGE